MGVGAGGTGSGGTSLTGGTSAGGSSAGGAAVGGSHAGGSQGMCVMCPSSTYGVGVSGDGENLFLVANASLAIFDPEGRGIDPGDCAPIPVRGTVAGCGQDFSLSVCAGVESTPPCLEVIGANARYVDRGGHLWSGTVLSHLGDNSGQPGVSSGGLLLEVSGGLRAETLFLTVSYEFCSTGLVLGIPC
jgi:hypothetical protein